MYTTKQVAQHLNLSEARVRQIAAELGVGTRPGRDWTFSAEDLAALKARPGAVASATWTCPDCGSRVRATRPEEPPRCWPPRWVCPWCGEGKKEER